MIASTHPSRLPRRGITAFLAIAFGLAWLPFVPALFGHDPVALILMPIAPAVAALIVRKWITREGFRDAGLRLNLRRWPLYVLAVGWPVATNLLSIVLAVLLQLAPGNFSMPWGRTAPESLTLLGWMLIALVAAPTFFGEEFGWRGYLQVRLLADRPLLSSVAIGLIWALWHLPMILVGGQETESIGWTLVLFPIDIVVMAVFLGWLRAVTGGIWAGSLAHASNNLTANNWHRLAFTGQTDGTPSVSADGLVVLAEAAVLLSIVAIHRTWRRPPAVLKARSGRSENPLSAPRPA